MDKKYQLYFDMDGVIYPLDKTVIDYYNIDWKDNYNWKDNTKFNWQDTSAPETYFENLLEEKNIFLDGETTDETKYYLNKLHEEGYIIKIITFPIWRGYCTTDKIRWLEKTFPWINVDKDVIMTGDKSVCAKSNRILIDDNKYNIQQWKEKGGIIIPFENFGRYTKDFDCLRSIELVYSIIKSFEKRR